MAAVTRDEEEYIKLRQRAGAQANLRTQMNDVRGRIRLMEADLFRLLQRSQMQRERVLHFCAGVRASSLRDLGRLAEQPWVSNLEARPNGEMVITAQVAGPKQELRLVVNLLAPEIVAVEHPAENRDQVPALLYSALATLALGGMFTELVQLAATHLGLALSPAQTSAPLPVSEVSTQHYNQHLQLLMQNISGTAAAPVQGDHLIRELVRLHQYLHELDMEGRKHGSSSDALVEQWKQEFQRICRTDHVQEVSVRGDTMQVHTGDMLCESVPIGRFTISVNYGTGALSIVNLTKARYCDETRYDHPHIRDGMCCLGNIYNAVQTFLATRDPQLVPLLISFLQHYNSASPYHQLDNWKT